jgi:c(7)-type cytochrome triheme protein
MTVAAWCKAFPALLALACVDGATGPSERLAFLRAVPQAEIGKEAASHDARAPGNAARQSLGQSEFYDPENPGFRYLQSYDKAVVNLPMDDNGFPDWMRALRDSNIQPRSGLKPGASMSILELDVVMKNTREMPFVKFPHSAHTLWLDCSNCHPVPFEPKAGSTGITMADIFRGKYCGVCHDRVAFVTFFSCQRCHSVPQRNGLAQPN